MQSHGRRGRILGSSWFITLGSLAAIAVLVALLWNPFDRRSHAGKTIVFSCAAGMKKPVEKIIRKYQEEYDVTVKPTYGGSGAMREKIKLHGGDLFLSADAFHMNLAIKEGVIKETIPIATIRPVLVIQKKAQEALQKSGQAVTGLSDLLREDLKAIIANPTKTSVGRLTKEMLEKAGMWPAFEKRRESSGKVVWLATVNEVALQVSIREDAVGIVWDATALEFDELQQIPLPEAHDLIETMSIGVAANSTDPTAALHFARYLSARDKGLPIFAEHHFQPIADADIWEHQPRLRVYYGTMLQDGLQPVLKAFQEREGVTIETKFNGCGVLVADMATVRGRRTFPDAYVSCDITFAHMVKDDFYAAQAILQNDMVFLVQRGNPRGIKADLHELERTDLKMGMPHPTNSAMGKITADVLDRQGIKPASTMVQFNSGHALITQMLTGALDLSVVGRSNASNSAESREKLEIIEIAGPILTQTIQIGKNSPHKHLLERFRDAVVAPESMKRFRELGFKTEVP